MKALMWNRRYWIAAGCFSIDDFGSLLSSVGFQVIDCIEHTFEPQGCSALFLLGESHFAVHTFPEYDLDYIELTSCNKQLLVEFNQTFFMKAAQMGCKVSTILPGTIPLDSFLDKQNSLIVEALPGGAYWVGKYTNLVVHKKTRHQEFTVVDDPRGRSLYIDGYLQSRESTEYMYHEMLVHPAMMGVDRVQSALILGGGEGAVLRELVRYGELERIVMVDIDGELVESSKTYLANWHKGAYNDPRVEVKIADGLKYVESCCECFDVVFLDLPTVLSDRTMNLSTIASSFVNDTFYLALAGLLREGGIIASYFGDFFDSLKVMWSVREIATGIFPYFWLYRINGILLKMFIASKRDVTIYNVNRLIPGPTQIAADVDDGIHRRVSSKLMYYNGMEHIASFALSNDMQHWSPDHKLQLNG